MATVQLQEVEILNSWPDGYISILEINADTAIIIYNSTFTNCGSVQERSIVNLSGFELSSHRAKQRVTMVNNLFKENLARKTWIVRFWERDVFIHNW